MCPVWFNFNIENPIEANQTEPLQCFILTQGYSSLSEERVPALLEKQKIGENKRKQKRKSAAANLPPSTFVPFPLSPPLSDAQYRISYSFFVNFVFSPIRQWRRTRGLGIDCETPSLLSPQMKIRCPISNIPKQESAIIRRKRRFCHPG